MKLLPVEEFLTGRHPDYLYSDDKLYSLGGFKAVAWTDTMQGLMMIFLVWIGGGVVLGKVTGTLDWSVLMNRVAQEVRNSLFSGVLANLHDHLYVLVWNLYLSAHPL